MVVRRCRFSRCLFGCGEVFGGRLEPGTGFDRQAELREHVFEVKKVSQNGRGVAPIVPNRMTRPERRLRAPAMTVR